MRLLLDTHIALAATRGEVARAGAKIDIALKSAANDIFISAASLWEIAIKHRLGKLNLAIPLYDLPGYFENLGFQHAVIDERHAVEDLAQWPDTRDPFDRLLLAQCQVERMRLLTVDGKIKDHPLAWKPA